MYPGRVKLEPVASRPARGAWIEIRIRYPWSAQQESRPARGAWIEIALGNLKSLLVGGRAPQGARGLKSGNKCHIQQVHFGRAPQGARGLKSTGGTVEAITAAVAPRKGRVD